jgi:hypothetical protein
MTYQLSDEDVALVLAGLHVVATKGDRAADRDRARSLILHLQAQRDDDGAYFHAYRSCRRTDEVLETYKRRAVEAETEILSLARGITQAPLALAGTGLHKAEPVPMCEDDAVATCIHCHKDIRHVPGGQGPTWVHSDTGAVVGS